jgi:RHS repeat-associated protein
LTFGSIFFGTMDILPTQKDAAQNLGRFRTPIYQQRANNTLIYYHQDQIGSTRLVTNNSGNNAGTFTYTAYGKPLTDTMTGFAERPLLGYTGQYHDTETGLQYLRARYLDVSTGQFVSEDPLESVTHEPHLYGGGNPAAFVDPAGLQADPVDPVEAKCIEDGGTLWPSSNGGASSCMPPGHSGPLPVPERVTGSGERGEAASPREVLRGMIGTANTFEAIGAATCVAAFGCPVMAVASSAGTVLGTVETVLVCNESGVSKACLRSTFFVFVSVLPGALFEGPAERAIATLAAKCLEAITG